jgi:hypothetical protein
MFGNRGIRKEVRVAATVDAGPLVEIKFEGKAWDGCGDELYGFVKQAVQELRPAGVVMNLIRHKTKSWDDIGPVFSLLYDSQKRQFLPFCIVAKKRTSRSLKNLFSAMQFPAWANDARFCDSVEEGLAVLEDELRAMDA